MMQGIDFITEPGEYQYFTAGFELVGFQLEKAKIVHYGIDESKLVPRTQMFVKREETVCY